MRPVTFVRRTQLVPGVWQAFFRPERPLHFQTGQYAELRLGRVLEDARGPQRTFTLTSLPTEPELSFIYRADEPVSPYKQVLQSLQPGEAAQVGEAMGDLVLPKMPSVPLVFLAGGIGMASFTAILRELSERGEQRTIHLFYALRNKYDDAFCEQVDAFPFASKRRAISPNYLKPADITKVLTDDTLIYLSGSERFVIGLRDALHAAGVDHSRIVFDYYDGYADL